MKKKLSAAVLAAASTLVCTVATAHVGVASGPATANANSEIVLSIGHGCEIKDSTETTDTVSLKVDIPAGVTGVRAISSTDFPTVTLDKDGAGNVTAITWSKAAGLDSDSQYYKLSFRAKMPDLPYTKVAFKAHQVCKAPGIPAEWIGGAGNQPAAEVVLLPAKTTGWNKIKVKAAVAAADMSTFFKDAQIVWKGTAAFSANPITAEQISKEPGVTALGSLAVDDEIFVKY